MSANPAAINPYIRLKVNPKIRISTIYYLSRVKTMGVIKESMK
jgi:hypothetical protein